MSSVITERSELLTLLGDFSELRPDWRLGQTLAILAMQAGRMEASAIWELTDEEAIETLHRLTAQFQTNEQDASINPE